MPPNREFRSRSRSPPLSPFSFAVFLPREWKFRRVRRGPRKRRGSEIDESVPRSIADIIPRIISAARLTRSVLRFSGVQRWRRGRGMRRRSVTKCARGLGYRSVQVDDDDARQENRRVRGKLEEISWTRREELDEQNRCREVA